MFLQCDPKTKCNRHSCVRFYFKMGQSLNRGTGNCVNAIFYTRFTVRVMFDRDWLDRGFDPHLKGRPRAMEKMKNDYKGDARYLKDLVRFTFCFNKCERMVSAFQAMGKAGFQIHQVGVWIFGWYYMLIVSSFTHFPGSVILCKRFFCFLPTRSKINTTVQRLWDTGISTSSFLSCSKTRTRTQTKENMKSTP